VGAAVMLGRHLDVLPAYVSVCILILNPYVGEVDLLVEVRQPVFARPVFDLGRRAVRPAVAVAVTAIALLQEALVFAFQLAVQFDAEDPRVACLEARRGLEIGAIELRVVGALPRAVCARVEGLATLRASVSVAFEQAAPVPRQRHGPFALIQRHTLDESLPLEGAEIVAISARISQIPVGHHSKRTDGCERPRLRSVQRVVAVAIAHELAVWTVWQVEPSAEDVSRIDSAIFMPIPRVAVAFVTRVIVATADVVLRLRGQPTAAASEGEVLLLAVANAVVALAGVDVAWIEVDDSPPYTARTEPSQWEDYAYPCVVPAIHDPAVSCGVGGRKVVRTQSSLAITRRIVTPCSAASTLVAALRRCAAFGR
jgi:hypothetical protein